MEPTNHPFRKENYLPNLHEDMFHVNLPRCKFGMNMFLDVFPTIKGSHKLNLQRFVFLFFSIDELDQQFVESRCERKGAFWSGRYLKSLQNRERFGATPRLKSIFFLF